MQNKKYEFLDVKVVEFGDKYIFGVKVVIYVDLGQIIFWVMVINVYLVILIF